MELDLGDEITMKLVSIPAGEFSMGSNDETPVEQPVCRVTIDKPFMMGTTEVTLEQYRQFDPDYLNGVYDMHYKDQVHRGYYMNDMQFPVIRVTWQQAMAFCDWLSKKTGKKVTLPTEAQWEWACRAGTDTPLTYGDLDTRLLEARQPRRHQGQEMAVSGVNPKPIAESRTRPWTSNSRTRASTTTSCTWPRSAVLSPTRGACTTCTATRPSGPARTTSRTPTRTTAETASPSGLRRVVRGGSWHDRPFRSTSSSAWATPTGSRSITPASA